MRIGWWKTPRPERGLLGTFAHVDALLDALRQCKEKQVQILDVYSPVQNEEVIALASPGRSPLRFITLVGAVAGLISGFSLALLTSAGYELMVGGKPVYSIVPFIVVGFELTILLGALFTLLGVLHFAPLPFRGFPAPAYRPEFSDDRFGVWLGGSEEQLNEARGILERAGAEGVELVPPGASRRAA